MPHPHSVAATWKIIEKPVKPTMGLIQHDVLGVDKKTWNTIRDGARKITNEQFSTELQNGDVDWKKLDRSKKANAVRKVVL